MPFNILLFNNSKSIQKPPFHKSIKIPLSQTTRRHYSWMSSMQHDLKKVSKIRTHLIAPLGHPNGATSHSKNQFLSRVAANNPLSKTQSCIII